MTASLCPLCGQPALTIRTSRAQSLVSREIYFTCHVCNEDFSGGQEIYRRMGACLLPPEMHRVKLPLSPAAEKLAFYNQLLIKRHGIPRQMPLNFD